MDNSSLEEYLKGKSFYSFRELVFAIDMYQMEKYSNSKVNHRSLKFTSHWVLDAVLEQSKGILLYHSQLEQLLIPFCGYWNSAINHRKAINQKQPWVSHRLYKFKFDENMNLLEVIRERMIFNATKMACSQRGIPNITICELHS